VLRLPTKCHAILKQLLQLLREAQKSEPVLTPLLGGLLTYLQATRAPRLAHAPPSLFQALLQGMKKGSFLSAADLAFSSSAHTVPFNGSTQLSAGAVTQFLNNACPGAFI
jgi:hypothetical protein